MKKLVLLSLLTLTLTSSLLAQTAAEKGLEIAQKIDQHDSGWVNQSADVEMILRNQHGQESHRKLKIKTLEDTDKSDDFGDKSLTIFKTPKDVKGTSFLSFAHNTGADKQWLYMPALKRVKQIASDNKSGPFMGSEFAFEDISNQEVEKYTYKYIKDVMVAGQPGYQLERYPVDKNSGYTKQVVLLDRAEYRIHSIDFYDRKGSHLKTLTYSDYKQYANNVWRADKMSMVNLLTGKSTDLLWKSYDFSSKLRVRDFDKNALKRVR